MLLLSTMVIVIPAANAIPHTVITVTQAYSMIYSNSYPNLHKQVTVRTIKMNERTADELRYSSKFNRSRDFTEKLRAEGKKVARDWLNDWRKGNVGKYPEDAAYRKI